MNLKSQTEHYDTRSTGILINSELFQKEMIDKLHTHSIKNRFSKLWIRFSSMLLLCVSILVMTSQVQAQATVGDSDYDGILDIIEGEFDTDGDGTPDYLDTDSDNDGIPDIIEGEFDADGDSTPNYIDTDSDGDGYDDIIEGEDDADCDTIPNFIDEFDSDGPCGDSDNDSLTNEDETLLGSNPNNPDSDGDGVNDGVEFGSGLGAQDTDGDTVIDILDTDDDGDSLSTRFERDRCTHGPMFGFIPVQNSSLQLNIVCRPSNSSIDSDGDGTPDYLDQNSDFDPSNPSPDSGTDLEEVTFWGVNGDNDGDLIPNVYDPNDYDGPDGDLDFDGFTNEEEAMLGTNPYDDDTDDDGIPDTLEVGNDPSNPHDSDGDGIIDALEVDDDGDGLKSSDEGVADIDGDGLPNFRDHDSDADDFPDACEGTVNEDVDGDGLPNFLDSNDDDGPNAGGVNIASGTGDIDCDGIIDHIDPNDIDGPCLTLGPGSLAFAAGAPDDPNACIESPYASTSDSSDSQARQFIQPNFINEYEVSFGKQSYQLNDISLTKNTLCDLQCRKSISKIINAKIGKTPLICKQVKMNGMDRISCELNGIDLSLWLIQNGWAMTNKYSSKEAIQAQNKAKNKGLGFWKTKAMLSD